jgi:hypothetical protein
MTETKMGRCTLASHAAAIHVQPSVSPFSQASVVPRATSRYSQRLSETVNLSKGVLIFWNCEERLRFQKWVLVCVNGAANMNL